MRRHRLQWLRDWAIFTVVAVVFFAAVVLVARWERGRECVRYATRIDAGEGGAYSTHICAEYRKIPSRDSAK